MKLKLENLRFDYIIEILFGGVFLIVGLLLLIVVVWASFAIGDSEIVAPNNDFDMASSLPIFIIPSLILILIGAFFIGFALLQWSGRINIPYDESGGCEGCE